MFFHIVKYCLLIGNDDIGALYELIMVHFVVEFTLMLNVHRWLFIAVAMDTICHGSSALNVAKYLKPLHFI